MNAVTFAAIYEIAEIVVYGAVLLFVVADLVIERMEARRGQP